jgi:streptogramin lyase
MTHHIRALIARTRTIAATAAFAVALAVAACSGSVSPTAAPSTTPSIPPSASQSTSTASTPAATPAGTPHPTPVPVATGTPLGDSLLATIKVSAAPCAMAFDATSAWVTSNSSGALDRIDAATNTVTQHAIVGIGPCGVAVGSDGRIWVADLGKGAVLAVDPTSLKVTGIIENVGPALWDLKGGFGSIWVADRKAKALLRIDPAKAKVVATIPIGPQPSGIAVLGDGVWVSDDTDYKLRRIDPKTNKVVTTIDAAGTPSWFADDGRSSMLVAERGAGKVVVVDPAAGTLGNTVGGFNEPLDGTVFAGRAWIPDGAGRRLGVIDLGNPGADVVRYALPNAIGPFVAEGGFGNIWVLDYSGTSVWRIRP